MAVRLSIAVPHPDLSQSLARSLGLSRLTAQLLINRGITDAAAGQRFMRPQLGFLHEPSLLPGVPQAADLIQQAIAEGWKITIYGDYDVDGLAGTTLLWQCLKLAGAQVDYYVPHRIEEGYGINAAALEQLAAAGTRLVISVDCGITSVEPIARARQAGLAVIVTDHHEPGPDLPPAAGVVHPRLAGGRYPFGHLSGAGVAFKLAWALGQKWSGTVRVSPEFREFLLASVALVALGTVADVVPLVDENRVLVRHGLQALAATPSPGLKALIEVSQLSGPRVDAYDIGFRLAPRLNAIGRLGHARLAVELLTTASPDRALEIAKFLDGQNRQRQTLERRLFREIADRVEAELDLQATPAICLAGQGWHAGIIGIVCSRLVDRFYRPTILVSLGEETAQGSGRSIPAFNLLEAIRAAGDHLLSFGGHAQAAGLRIDPARFEAFRDRFYEVARQWLDPKDLVPEIRVDAEASLEALSPALVREFQYLAPFGPGNPPPVLLSRQVQVVGEPRLVGGGGRHLSFLVRQDGQTIRAIGFGMADRLQELLAHRRCDLVYEPVLNQWQGRTSVDLQVQHLSVG